MAIVNYVREHTRFIEYAADEHVSTGERLLWYALMHIFNQRAQGNVWPDEFIRISNDRLLSYCGMKFDTMAEARNRLRQRGLIEFTRGERNKVAPAYRMIYFYPQYKAPNTELDGFYPEKSDYIGGYLGDNMGDNLGGNPGDNLGDISINNTYTENEREISHTTDQQGNPGVRGRGREGSAAPDGYVGLDGKKHPPRFDAAWKTSARVRGAVAQRILDKLPFPRESGSEIHGRIIRAMELGVCPELIEDCGQNTLSVGGFLRMVDKITPEENDAEWEKCMRIAHGDEEFARRLYRVSVGEERQAE